jgi:signal transduction histidine kinase
MRSDWALDVASRQETADDVAAIGRLESVKVALKVLWRATGLRIAVVARVTDHSWTACAVLDEVGFGLLAGDELELRTTFCSLVEGAAAPLLINHASADPRFVDHPAPRLYGIESYIAVPLNRRDGTYFGTLCALDPLPATLTPESFQIFHLLASLIAYELEAEDAERSAREAAERILSQAQELARLEERERIAMDLHDGVVQSLYAVVLGLGVQELSSDSAESAHGIEQAIDRINGVINDLRNNIFDLGLQDITRVGLADGIELLAAELCTNTSVRPSLDLAVGADSLLTQEGIRNLLHIAREATSNVVRHARANTIAIRLARVEDWLELSVVDDGCEFQAQTRDTHQGNGLRNIYERARLAGGAAEITSRAGIGTGTRVVVRVPVAYP